MRAQSEIAVTQLLMGILWLVLLPALIVARLVVQVVHRRNPLAPRTWGDWWWLGLVAMYILVGFFALGIAVGRGKVAFPR